MVVEGCSVSHVPPIDIKVGFVWKSTIVGPDFSCFIHNFFPVRLEFAFPIEVGTQGVGDIIGSKVSEQHFQCILNNIGLELSVCKNLRVFQVVIAVLLLYQCC